MQPTLEPVMKTESGEDDAKLQVSALRGGTVLDHLRAGTALRTLRLLDLPPEATVLIGVNLPSTKLGRKDLVKVEGLELTAEEINRVALMSPSATLVVVRDYKVTEKRQAEVPDQVEGSVSCVNPACISTDPRVKTRFQVESKDPLRLRCFFCERSFPGTEIEFL